MTKLNISILIDNPKSWFVPHGHELARQLRERGHSVSEVGSPTDIPNGDIAFFLSCEQIIKKEVRDRNRHNLVIHASALPHGKGWSPTTWKIIEGENEIPLTLFEAVDKVDAGDIYATGTIVLEGHELIDEVREKEGKAIIDLALQFVDVHPNVSGRPQEGEETFYPRRKPEHSELDPNKSLIELFNHLRVADNERYPAFFTHNGHSYLLKIYKKEGRSNVVVREKALRAVLFDLDGTLAESVSSLYGAYAAFLGRFGITGTREEFNELGGSTIGAIVATLKERYALGDSSAVLQEAYHAAVADVYREMNATPGADALLRGLVKEGYALGIVTSAPRALAESFVKRQGWDELFSLYVCGDEATHTKPHPEMYQKAIDLLGEMPEEIAVVEDSAQGVLSAIGAGLRTIGFAHQGTEDELYRAGADTIVSELSEIPGALASWNAEPYRIIAVGDITVTAVPQSAELKKKLSRKSEHIETAWAALSRTRPLFNGAMLNIASVTKTDGHIVIGAHSVSYKDFLAERNDPSLKLGIRPIGVSGLLLVKDAQGLEYAVFASRKASVTQWPGRLELVPSGSIDARHITPSGSVAYEAQIREELSEEVGVEAKNVKTITGFALVYDAQERVYDICCTIELSLRKEDLEKIFTDSVEYEKPLYIPYKDIDAFIALHKEEIVPTSLALLAARTKSCYK